MTSWTIHSLSANVEMYHRSYSRKASRPWLSSMPPLAIGHEIRDDKVVHSRHITPCEEIFEPAFDDVYMFWRRCGVAPLYP
jgi:hypothetical protein